MGKIALFVKRVLVMLGILLALWLPLLAFVHYLEISVGKDLAKVMWITRVESVRLMRYHGTNGLKVTNDRVYIWRDSRWIPVMKRNPV
ncbi:MAG TPA: hypothetical protein VK863_05970 [Candidatus Limnocylindrales bacterium]|nr:hypothetical protein [Candidatus Limnocylindrales bacterium]